MTVVGVIPCRMASTRFPGKPLKFILNKPMIQHVYENAKQSQILDRIIIATCDDEIKDCAKDFGAEVIMTSDAHERCTDRVAEAVSNLSADIVVVLQGDEPLVAGDMISMAVEGLKNDPDAFAVNLISKIDSIDEMNDPNEIKVVKDLNDYAVYFSRQAIPSFVKSDQPVRSYKQICAMPFRYESLIQFNALSETPLEMVESIDMLRIIEHGYKVKLVETQQVSYSVDTEEDLKKVETFLSFKKNRTVN